MCVLNAAFGRCTRAGTGHCVPASRSRTPFQRQTRCAPLDCTKRHGDVVNTKPDIISYTEIASIARGRDMTLSRETFGPFYRIVCRQGSTDGSVLAETSGFVAPPFKLAHCDMLQIYSKRIQSAGSSLDGPLLMSVLLGGAVFAHILACGCDKAEILAINDDDSWHARLVRYYRFFGFRVVCEVGERGLADLPHQLVWGGVGTRMDADVAQVLARWTPALRRADKSVTTV